MSRIFLPLLIIDFRKNSGIIFNKKKKKVKKNLLLYLKHRYLRGDKLFFPDTKSDFLQGSPFFLFLIDFGLVLVELHISINR